LDAILPNGRERRKMGMYGEEEKKGTRREKKEL
jgi:hypothetical protein